MFKTDIDRCLTVLKEGGVILYPTDTIWGLGCDATNEAAVERINQIKGRAADKSFIILLDTDAKLQSYVSEVPEVAYDLIEYAENPMTVIFDNARNLTKNVINKDGSVGIRVVRNDFVIQLLQRFRKPIVSTSANVSGAPSPANFDMISDEIKSQVDYIVEHQQDDRREKKPSTIIKIGAGGQFSFIRK